MNRDLRSFSLGPTVIDYDPPCISIDQVALTEAEFPAQLIATNGSGKSSLALALAGAIPEVIWARLEMPFTLTTSDGVLSFEESRAEMRIVPQNWNQAYLGFTLAAELSVGAASRAWAAHLKDVLDLDRFNERDLQTLSSGEKKRLLIAKGLLPKPTLLITDEWDQHLDQDWRGIIWRLFEESEAEFGCKLLALDSSKVGGISYATDIRAKASVSEGRGDVDRSVSSALANVVEFLRDDGTALSPPGCNQFSVFLEELPTREGPLGIEASPGTLTIISGPNGSGKTSTLVQLWRESRSVRRKLSRAAAIPPLYLVQADPMYQVLGPRVEDEFRRALSDRPDAAKTQRTILELLEGIERRDVLTLSFGERKLLAIVVAFLRSEGIILLDEPFAGLDERNKRCVEDLIRLGRINGFSIVAAEQSSPFADARVIPIG